jgi:hypothetical protein
MDPPPEIALTPSEDAAGVCAPTIEIMEGARGRIVVLEGEHDLATIAGVVAALHQATHVDGGVIVDVSGCTYIDCATIGGIATAAGTSPVAVFAADRTDPTVRRLLDVLHLPTSRVCRPAHPASDAGDRPSWESRFDLDALLARGAAACGVLYRLDRMAVAGPPEAGSAAGRRPADARARANGDQQAARSPRQVRDSPW